jgi:hypothetical protein
LAPKVPKALKLLWAHQMVLLGGLDQVKIVSVCMEIVLTSMQDRCMVCAERTIASEIILGAIDGRSTKQVPSVASTSRRSTKRVST